MTDLTTGTDTASRLPARIGAMLDSLGAATAEGLTQAECLEVVDLLEATKGAAAALQARATACFVGERDADATDAMRRGGATSLDMRHPASAARPDPRWRSPVGARRLRQIDT